MDQAVQLALRDEIWQQAVQVAERPLHKACCTPSHAKALRRDSEAITGRLPHQVNWWRRTTKVLPPAPYVSIPLNRSTIGIGLMKHWRSSMPDAEFANGEDQNRCCNSKINASPFSPHQHATSFCASGLVEFAAAAAAIHVIQHRPHCVHIRLCQYSTLKSRRAAFGPARE